MDSRWFGIILGIIIIVVLVFLNYGNTNFSLIQVDQYPNCNRSRPDSFRPFHWDLYEIAEQNFTWEVTESKGECCYPPECPQSKNNPKECHCLYLIECFISEDEYNRLTVQ